MTKDEILGLKEVRVGDKFSAGPFNTASWKIDTHTPLTVCKVAPSFIVLQHDDLDAYYKITYEGSFIDGYEI
jgi:hypothetical protein